MTNTQAVDYAIGLIKIDGIEPTDDFKAYIEKEKKGEITLEDAKKYLDKEYKIKETGKNAAYDTFVQPDEIGVLIEKKRIGTGKGIIGNTDHFDDCNDEIAKMFSGDNI